METHCSYIPYQQTGYFSKLVIDYLDDEKALRPFYTHRPQLENISEALSSTVGSEAWNSRDLKSRPH